MDGLLSAFVGRLGQEAELRFTGQGKPMVTFSAVLWDKWAMEQGLPDQWIRVSLFGDKAEELAPRLTKGCEVYAEGKLSLDVWEATDGTQRHTLKLLAWVVQPMGQIGRRGRPQPDGDDQVPEARAPASHSRTPVGAGSRRGDPPPAWGG